VNVVAWLLAAAVLLAIGVAVYAVDRAATRKEDR